MHVKLAAMQARTFVRIATESEGTACDLNTWTSRLSCAFRWSAAACSFSCVQEEGGSADHGNAG